MLEELDQLAERVRQLTQLTQQIRQENQDLRLRLTSAESENRHLHEKLNLASSRVESILERLPDSTNLLNGSA
jgi:cell division protein ZapB